MDRMTGGDAAPIGVVVRSMELERVLRLPRRVLDLTKTLDVTPAFRCPGGTMTFWPIQSAAIVEASEANGLLAPIGVGCGKSLISYAVAEAMNSRVAVLLVPAELKEKSKREIPLYQKHFRLPIDRLHIIAYTELSSATHANILERIGPDLIIADECHALAHPSAARTKRFLRYFRQHPECRFVGMSGSITRRSIIDYAHLAELALRKNSPLPIGYNELRDWAGALDIKPAIPMRPGALMKFCELGEPVRSGYRRRLIETSGVVATSDEELEIGLVVGKPILFPLPPELADLLDHLHKTWELPEDGCGPDCIDDKHVTTGEVAELDGALDMARVIRQLICGFYYTLDWPGEPDHEWLEARSNWAREVRTYLAHAARAGMDSPALLTQAAMSGRWESVFWPAWDKVRHRNQPPTKPIWLDDFLVQQAVAWGEGRCDGAIIWYEHRALGEAIASMGKWPLYDGGMDAETATAPVIVCSMKAQGTGKNLQTNCGPGRAGYWQNLFTTMPSSGLMFEQVIGRTHRPGQEKDDVLVDWFGHVSELRASRESVMEDSRYVFETSGMKYRALYATWL